MPFGAIANSLRPPVEDRVKKKLKMFLKVMQKDHVRRDRKLAKTHPAAKKCCGWEKPAIYCESPLLIL